MLEIFNIDTSNYKVYLRADYTPLHDLKELQVAKILVGTLMSLPKLILSSIAKCQLSYFKIRADTL